MLGVRCEDVMYTVADVVEWTRRVVEEAVVGAVQFWI